ncbi:DUF7693 family protein [Halopseudomonas sabulinigri]|uniref:DUF7693 domain-containing protein n=1 Tax=Halopseudomonas sabulinigri TaxID=472181 RepID=A0A1H1XXP9_9GAMM|nr:hypothetical protein [Halopseudomonas sabulinigri]SDT14027.1 hypothetical protein SAMN05216271_3709 [Halopseudomonas sabulinigri]
MSLPGSARALQAREVYQVLKDIALEQRRVIGKTPRAWGDVASGEVAVEVDGYRLRLRKEAGELDYCIACTATDGRSADMHCWAGAGTDPLELLSVWERARLIELLAAE